ncbi:hypothetical protein EUTSA_v10023941mg [Eutrema salsugineum]|uniref:Uncharacterized protein n=1 Tax=Eutrema salsugineum TaxID=72664 RepID=V4KIC9_EUTSA|nr:hypothetical protein EUTSA_v10023941mg [Eutrema salsugineum]
MTAHNFPLVLPWSWFGSAVGLIGALFIGFGLLADTVHSKRDALLLVKLPFFAKWRYRLSAGKKSTQFSGEL